MPVLVVVVVSVWCVVVVLVVMVVVVVEVPVWLLVTCSRTAVMDSSNRLAVMDSSIRLALPRLVLANATAPLHPLPQIWAVAKAVPLVVVVVMDLSIPGSMVSHESWSMASALEVMQVTAASKAVSSRAHPGAECLD